MRYNVGTVVEYKFKDVLCKGIVEANLICGILIICKIRKYDTSGSEAEYHYIYEKALIVYNRPDVKKLNNI